jgi:formate dehydrogenase major subunit
LGEGDRARVSSRRGSVVVPIHIDAGLRAGLVFTTLHFNDEVATNLLTIDATDPQSGTAEFKACAVRVEAFESPFDGVYPERSRGAQGDKARSFDFAQDDK